jgi:hypothetical protein
MDSPVYAGVCSKYGRPRLNRGDAVTQQKEGEIQSRFAVGATPTMGLT